MAVLHKNKNIFQKLALPVALIVTAAYFGCCWYVYFAAESPEMTYSFNRYIKYLLWGVYEFLFVFSFSANNATEFARHVLYYFIAGALCIGVLYYWLENVFEPDMSDLYWRLVYDLYDSYHLDKFRSLTVNAVGLTLFGAIFCGIKYSKNNKNWLRKHTY